MKISFFLFIFSTILALALASPQGKENPRTVQKDGESPVAETGDKPNPAAVPGSQDKDDVTAEDDTEEDDTAEDDTDEDDDTEEDEEEDDEDLEEDDSEASDSNQDEEDDDALRHSGELKPNPSPSHSEELQEKPKGPN